MATINVQLTLDRTGTKLNNSPPVVVVNPLDTVQWKCDEGAITVSFEGQPPLFQGSARFQAQKGQSTSPGTVRADVARGTHFNCVVTFNGKEMPVTYGIDTSGSGG